jgi:hypothetical protein
MIIDILAVIVVAAVGLRYLARYEVKPVKPLTDDEKLEQRRREAVRKANAAYEHEPWWT